jgi:hypothetical protein
MSDSTPPAAPPATPRLQWLRFALPHIVTALASVALTLALVLALRPLQPAYVLPERATSPPAAPTANPAASAPTPTAPSQPLPDERVLAQEVLDLRARLDQTWSSVYITRAALQIADAEAALRANDIAEVERLLAASDASLALAYERSDQVNRGPLGELRAQLSQMRDDIHLMPEGLDQRLKSMRQVMMALIEET